MLGAMSVSGVSNVALRWLPWGRRPVGLVSEGPLSGSAFRPHYDVPCRLPTPVLGGRLSMTGTRNHSLIWVMIRIVCPQPASVAPHILVGLCDGFNLRPTGRPGCPSP